MAKSYLSECRNARGISQGDLARRSGLNQGHVSEIENGNRALSLPDARKIAPHVGTKSSELFARQLSTRTAIKAQTAKAGAVHSAIGEIQDLIEDAGSDEEREALQAAVDELKALAEKDEPDDADTATKAQSRAARKGRDTLGRKRRDSGVATKSAGEPRRDHLGRSNRRPGDQSQ